MIQLLLICGVVLAMFFLQRKYYASEWIEDMDVRVQFLTAEIPEGEEGKLRIQIENRKWLPLPMLMVKFQTDRNLEFEKSKGSVATDQFYHNDVFQVGGGEKVTRMLRFYGKKRGYYRINNIDLTSADLFMTCQLHHSFQPEESIYILPKPLESRDFQLMMQQLGGDMITKRNLYEDPFELRGIREYQPFDNRKSINWKATAKTGHLMVNQKNYTAPKTVRIFLNLEDRNILRSQPELEAAIRIGAGLAKYLLEQGIKVAFYSNGVDVMTGDPLIKSAGKGPNQISSIMRGLARINTDKDASSFDQLFRKRLLNDPENTYTCIISPLYDQAFLDLLLEFSGQGRVFSWFYPASHRFHVEEIPLLLRNSLKQVR